MSGHQPVGQSVSSTGQHSGNYQPKIQSQGFLQGKIGSALSNEAGVEGRHEEAAGGGG